MTNLALKQIDPCDSRYSAVDSWILDFDGNEIDERHHGFIAPANLTPGQRISLISDELGFRMWCDSDAEYIDKDDFMSDDFDSVHTLKVKP